ncbi:MAG TPA: hypothetical protein VGW10_08360, partial [Solirubrobacteraceae bacterium]|nr:hypothetical protein [Solirubrobacteraceae bacterium]
MPELETRLAALRSEMEWPATPDLAGVVVARLEVERPRAAGERRGAGARRRGFALPRRLVVVVAAALL